MFDIGVGEPIGLVRCVDDGVNALIPVPISMRMNAFVFVITLEPHGEAESIIAVAPDEHQTPYVAMFPDVSVNVTVLLNPDWILPCNISVSQLHNWVVNPLLLRFKS